MSFLCCQFKDVKDPSQGYIDPSSPLTDVRVRRALVKAINYDDLNKGLFGGKGSRMVNNPLHPSRPGWDPSWETRWQEQYGYDQAAARRLLTEAGYSASNPLKVNLPTRSAPGIQSAEDVSEAIAAYWRAVGIEVAIRAVEPGQFSQQSNNLQLFNDVVVQATSAKAWTGIFNYGSSLLHRSPGPEQADVDAILDRMRNTSDVEAHTPMWKEIGEKLFVAHHFIPLFWLPTTATYNPKYVSDYLFPGSISGNWTHVENIKAAK
jgi:peptide/nickel transport system substrate-binding protein